jgi:tetratricopeptide (TPR) repeat protein
MPNPRQERIAPIKGNLKELGSTRRPGLEPAGLSASPSTRSRALPLAFLVAISCVAYINAGHKEFLFDDGKDVLTNPSYDPTIAAAFQRFWRERSTSDAPLTYLTFALNHAFNRAIGFKDADLTSFLAVNVLIHAINACLVFFLVRALLRQVAPDLRDNIWIPLAAATLFAVHPMHASSVAYVMQRRGSLATMFYMLAVLAYLRARAEWGAHRFSGGVANPTDDPSPPRLARERAWPWRPIVFAAAVLLCCWLSISSKNLGLTLPLMILAIEFCLRAPDRPALRRYLRWLLPGVAASIAGVVVFLWRQGLFDVGRLEIKPFGENADWGPWAHFLTESRVFVHYWKLLLLPLPRWMCIDHGFQVSRSLLDHYAVVFVAFHGLVVAAGVIAAFRRYTLAAVGIAWFYVTLIPYVLLPQAELMVEYKTYLPSVGLVLIVAEVLHSLRDRVTLRWQAPVVALTAVALLAATLARNTIYRSSLALWTDAVAKSPDHARPYYNLADALVARDRLEESLKYYGEAARLAPTVPQIRNNHGIALLKLKRYPEAARQLKDAIRLEPRFTEAHNNLGTALYEMGRLEDAVAQYREAYRLERQLPGARYNLGTSLAELGDALFGQGKTNEANACYREAVAVLPDLAELRFAAGNAAAKERTLDEAIRCYEQAVRIRPDYAEAFTNLGNALVMQKRDDQAFLSFQRALQLDPGLVAAHLGAAYVLERRGNPGEAAAHYEAVLRIDPSHARARAALEALRGKR